jgi:hypothetical protein
MRKSPLLSNTGSWFGIGRTLDASLCREAKITAATKSKLARPTTVFLSLSVPTEQVQYSFYQRFSSVTWLDKLDKLTVGNSSTKLTAKSVRCIFIVAI